MLKKIGILFFLLSVACSKAQQNQLIPREDLFEQPSERFFWPTFSGDYLFWLNSSENKLEWIQTETKNQGFKTFTDRIYQVGPFNGNKVAIIMQAAQSQEDQLVFFDLKSGVLNEARKGSRMRINQWTPSGMVYSTGNGRNNSDPNFYHLSFDMKLDELGRFPGLQNILFNGQLKPATAKRMHPDGAFELLYFKNEEWKVLQKLPWSEGNFLGGLQGFVSGSADGNKLYYVSNHETDKNVLYEFDLITETSNVIATSDNADILPQGALLDEDFKPIYVVSLFAKSQKHFVQDWFREHYKIIDEGIEGDISVVDPMWDAGIIIFREFTGGPSKYYIYDINKKKIEFLYEEFPNLKKYDFAKRTPHSFKTSDGLELPIHVYLPNGSDRNQDGIPDRPLPTVIYVHGGPWVGLIHFNNWLHTRNFQLLANRGYVVVVAEFRGTTGLGKNVIKKSYKKWGTDMTRDKKELSEWLVTNKIAAKDKIGIWGWSYGGYAAMSGLTFYPDTYACGIAMYGPPSIIPEEGTAGYDDPYWAKQVGDPNVPEDLKMLKEQSPINYIENITKPLLLTTGARDNRISKPMNDLMAKKMKEAGKDITYFFYPEEGHDYRNPKSWTSFWGIAEEFLHNNLGGKYEPYTPNSDVNYVMVYPLVKNEDSILGNWQAPGNMKFEITKEDDWYIGRVVNPGQITILKKDDFLFKIKKEDEEYKGSYRRYFERGEYVDDPCTFQFVDGEISTSYGVKYRRLSV